MKNKFLIIPTCLLSITIIGCDSREVERISLGTWLGGIKSPSEDPNAPTFSVILDDGESQSSYDFDLVIGNALKKVSYTGFEKSGKKEKKYSFNYMIREHINRFDGCFIDVYEDGTLTTSAYASGWGAPKSQFYTYEIGEEAAKEIIDLAKNRYVEIKEIRKTELEEKYGEMSVDGFFKAAEESQIVPTLFCGELSIPTVQDNDYAYLKELKEFEYKEIAKVPDGVFENTLGYSFDDNIAFRIYHNTEEETNSYAMLQYKYEGSLKIYPGYTYFHCLYYSINYSKVSDFINKIKTIK